MQIDNPHAYFGRAFALKAVRDYFRAAADFEKAKELDPNNALLKVNYKQLQQIVYISACRPGEEVQKYRDYKEERRQQRQTLLAAAKQGLIRKNDSPTHKGVSSV